MDALERLYHASIEERERKPIGKVGRWRDGYEEAAAMLQRFLRFADRLVEKGKNIVLTAQVELRRYQENDLTIDRSDLKLEKEAAKLVKDWCDELLFLTFDRTVAVKDRGGKQISADGSARPLH